MITDFQSAVKIVRAHILSEVDKQMVKATFFNVWLHVGNGRKKLH